MGCLSCEGAGSLPERVIRIRGVPRPVTVLLQRARSITAVSHIVYLHFEVVIILVIIIFVLIVVIAVFLVFIGIFARSFRFLSALGIHLIILDQLLHFGHLVHLGTRTVGCTLLEVIVVVVGGLGVGVVGIVLFLSIFTLFLINLIFSYPFTTICLLRPILLIFYLYLARISFIIIGVLGDFWRFKRILRSFLGLIWAD